MTTARQLLGLLTGAMMTLGCGGEDGKSAEQSASGGAVTTGEGGAVTTGEGGAVTTGEGGAVTTGEGGAVTTGEGGAVTTGEGGAVTTGEGGAPATGGSLATDGCNLPPPATVPSTVDVGGTERTFVLDVPANYQQGSPTPVLIAFHGMGTDGELFRSQFYGNLLSAFGDDYLVVHPDALGDPTSWDSQGDSDVAFFDALVALLEATYCVDASRIFATGHSSGGFFTNVLGCQRGDVLRGIAPQSGGGPFFAQNCVGPLAAIILHGTDDPSVTLESGEGSRDHWGEEAGCELSTSSTWSANEVCLSYADCDPATPVVFCPYVGDHNIWEEAPEAIFSFFQSL